MTQNPFARFDVRGEIQFVDVLKIARAYFLDASDEYLGYVIWNATAWPFSSDRAHYHKMLKEASERAARGLDPDAAWDEFSLDR